MKIDEEEILKSFNYLRNSGSTVEDLRKQPALLCRKEIVFRNQHDVLMECGSSNVSFFILKKYAILISQTESKLKTIGIIRNEINVQQRLADILNVKLHPCSDDVSLKTIRMHILRLFFSQNNVLSAKEFDDAFKKDLNSNIIHTPFRTKREMIELLIDRLHLPREKLLIHFDAIHADPDNVKKIISMESIGGDGIKDILRRAPYLMLVSYESIRKTLDQIQKLGIREESVTKCLRVLTLDSQIVHDRLVDLLSRKEFRIMKFHPRLLQLVVQKFTAQARMNYLNQLGRKCYNVHNLTGDRLRFER